MNLLRLIPWKLLAGALIPELIRLRQAYGTGDSGADELRERIDRLEKAQYALARRMVPLYVLTALLWAVLLATLAGVVVLLVRG